VAEEAPTVAEIKAAIRKATIAMKLFPVICGSAFKNKGVQPMLDAVVDYLPSPLDIPATIANDPKTGNLVERPPKDDGALLGPGLQDHDRTRSWASWPSCACIRAASTAATPCSTPAAGPRSASAAC
jgi:hypothetical protein